MSVSIWLDILGWIGMSLFVLAYYLLSSGRIKLDGLCYQWMNLFGAIFVGASVVYKQAWPALVLEVVWGAIALGALVTSYVSRIKK